MKVTGLGAEADKSGASPEDVYNIAPEASRWKSDPCIVDCLIALEIGRGIAQVIPLPIPT
jgi:hypothetical protein